MSTGGVRCCGCWTALYDFTKAHRLLPGRAYGVLPGKVRSADKRYRVIELVKPDAKHNRSSNLPVPGDGAGR